MGGECVVRINHKYAVAMGLTPIDQRPGGRWESSASEGHGGRHVSKINRTKQPTSHARDDGKRALTLAARWPPSFSP